MNTYRCSQQKLGRQLISTSDRPTNESTPSSVLEEIVLLEGGGEGSVSGDFGGRGSRGSDNEISLEVSPKNETNNYKRSVTLED